MPATIKYILMLTVFAAVNMSAKAQNFIGLTSTEIAGVMKSVNPQYKINKDAVNHTFNYLKYEDKISEQTILFFLSDKNICTYVRWMSDYSNLNDMITMLNKEYIKSSANTWEFTEKGEDYTVKLEEDEWYFTVSFRKN